MNIFLMQYIKSFSAIWHQSHWGQFWLCLVELELILIHCSFKKTFISLLSVLQQSFQSYHVNNEWFCCCVAVLYIGSVNCLDPGPSHSEECKCTCGKGMSQAMSGPTITLQGQAIGIQQSWRKLVTEELILTQDIRDVLLQSPVLDRVRILSLFFMHVHCPQ
jgi:hypothetical protein